ncbi:AIG1 family protein [Hondaea fermentalgiana]|uniref:AIG1 family protein n=1 Tax=Hondaea fermentalgiana TaxID=2315210 RepID=A0A2R5GRY6_9STRA|nr:AIG1 family protein [Hondaea fermentalgiana]|eukprot:GBG33642.1 AIG1 family protein [Hondaea fermentalgiana]
MSESRDIREHEVTIVNMPPSRATLRRSIIPRFFLDKPRDEFEGLLRADADGVTLVVFSRTHIKQVHDAIRHASAKAKLVATLEDILDFGLDDDPAARREGQWYLTVTRKGKPCKYEFRSKTVFQAVGWLQTLRKLRGESIIPIVAVLGETGVGKSLLCSQLAGLDPNNTIFRVDATAKSVTSTTDMYLTHWLGQKEEGNEVIVIDTPGLSDSQHRDDANVSDMLGKLADLGGVHTFVVLFNSQDPRLRGPLEQMLSVFERRFKTGFWEHTLIMFTRWYDDPISQRRRPKSASDLETEWNSELRERFPAIEDMLRVNKDIPCYFVDNDPLDEDEKEKTLAELRRFSVEARQNDLFDCRRVLADPRAVADLFREYTIPEEARELAEFLRAKALEDKLQGLTVAGILTITDLIGLQDIQLIDYFGWTMEDCDNLRNTGRKGPIAPNFVVVNEFRGLDIPTEGLLRSGLGAAELLSLDDGAICDRLDLKWGKDLRRYHKWREEVLKQQPVSTSTIFAGAIVVRNEEVWDHDGQDAMDQDWSGPGMVLSWTDMNRKVYGTTRPPRDWTGNPTAFDAPILPGWCRVYWFATGFTNCYRIGYEDRHDLRYEVGEDVGILEKQAHKPSLCKFATPSHLDAFTKGDLRCTFGFRIGARNPHWARFDVRPEVCRAVGGFAPGDVIRLNRVGHEAICIGLAGTNNGIGLSFFSKADEGATIYPKFILQRAAKGKPSRVTEVKHSDMLYHADTGPSNDRIAKVALDMEADFPYVIGAQYEEQAMFDTRPEIIGVFAPGLKCGDQLGLNAGDRGYRTLTVIGVAKHNSEHPRLFMHADNHVGATVWPRLHEHYHEGEEGRLKKVGTETVRPVTVAVDDFTPPSEAELRKLQLLPMLEFPVGNFGARTAKFDVRPEVCGRLCGFKPGTVLSFRRRNQSSDSKSRAFTVIGILPNPETGLPAVWFHEDGDRGAMLIPAFYELRSSLVADEETRDLNELREELAKMPDEPAGDIGMLLALLRGKAMNSGAAEDSGEGASQGAGSGKQGGDDDSDDEGFDAFLEQMRRMDR